MSGHCRGHKGRLKSALWDRESCEIATQGLYGIEGKIVILCFEHIECKKKKGGATFFPFQLGIFYISKIFYNQVK